MGMDVFVLYASALAIAYFIAKMLWLMLIIAAVASTSIVVYVARDIANMLRIKRERRRSGLR